MKVLVIEIKHYQLKIILVKLGHAQKISHIILKNQIYG